MVIPYGSPREYLRRLRTRWLMWTEPPIFMPRDAPPRLPGGWEADPARVPHLSQLQGFPRGFYFASCPKGQNEATEPVSLASADAGLAVSLQAPFVTAARRRVRASSKVTHSCHTQSSTGIHLVWPQPQTADHIPWPEDQAPWFPPKGG